MVSLLAAGGGGALASTPWAPVPLRRGCPWRSLATAPRWAIGVLTAFFFMVWRW